MKKLLLVITLLGIFVGILAFFYMDTSLFSRSIDKINKENNILDLSNKSLITNIKKKRKKIYLSHPLLFSKTEREILLPRFIAILESLDLEVYEPWRRNNINKKNKNWAYLIGQRDLNDIKECDAIFAILNGVPDEGVAVEIGVGIALKKKIFIFRDDFRNTSDTNHYPLNLMFFTGYDQNDWKNYYFTDFSEIVSPNKALYKWAVSQKI